MDNKTEGLFDLLLKYKEDHGTYGKIVEYIEKIYKKYTVWDRFPMMKSSFDEQNRIFILENLSKINNEKITERIEWNSIFVKLDNENGILIHYGSNRLFVVSGSLIETYVFKIKYDEE